MADGAAVSIHARDHWRATPYRGSGEYFPPWFQSTPAITGERRSSQALAWLGHSSFNPRPPSLASDASLLAEDWMEDCFNPRPPSLASELPLQTIVAPQVLRAVARTWKGGAHFGGAWAFRKRICRHIKGLEAREPTA
jgi:hypothetical protein